MPRASLSSLDQKSFDVIVIGAGINGASSAQHLSEAGYSVLLVDKGDFASGSSSRSSRLLHCGLRYFETPRPLIDFALAPGKFIAALKLAKSAMEMRSEIVKDSGDRVRPFKLLFPLLRDGPYRGWQLDAAFRILGSSESGEAQLNYQRLKAAECSQLPFVGQLDSSARLNSVAMFTEYMFDWPERFCIDAVLDAERMGAVVRNYTRASLIEQDDEGIWQIRLTDELTECADAHVRAPIVLNMAGIWIDDVNETSTGPTKRLVFGTKGSHIVVKLPDQFKDYGLATINSMGEPHYVLPSQGGYHHIGPTETVYEGDLDDIRVDAGDRDFLIKETAKVLPGLEITDKDVVYTWAGVRPLGFDPAYKKGSRSLAIHDLVDDDMPGVFALTAGPIMTHRSAGREMTAIVQEHLSPSGERQQLDYTPRRFPENPNSPPLLDGDDRIRLSDLAHAAMAEHGVSLADILIARTGVAYNGPLSDASIERAASAVGIHIGWKQAEIDSQIESAKTRFHEIYQVNND